MQISVKHDVQSALRSLSDLQRNAVPRAAARALNRTADQVQSAAVKEIAAETGLLQKDVRAVLTRIRATWDKLTAVVISSGRAANLIRFGARQTRAGVSANAWGKRKVYPHTFIANQGRTVFVRRGAARLPIRPVFGPSIPREMAREKVAALLKRTAAERWPINFKSELDFYTGKR